MSRCFPFPPPGYEKKTRSDDADLITKEKHKEKRHKKDKKNRDKRGGNDKKDEERSKEKNREKKDRKEKKKDKKDKKEKNKDKEKSRTSDEKRIEGKPASYNGQNPHPDNLPGVEINDSKIVLELGQRLGDKSKIAGIQTFQKVNLMGNGRPELQVDGHIGSSSEGKTKSADKNGMGKVNGQGNKVEARSPENAAIHNHGWMDQRRIDQGPISTLFEAKRKTDDNSGAGRANGQGIKVEARGAENAISHNSGWVDQRRVVQSNIGNWTEEKWKSNNKHDTGRANGQGNKVEARAPQNPTVFNSPWMDQRRTEQIWAEEKGKTKDKDDSRKANGQGNGVEARGPETAAVHRMDQRRIEGMQVKMEDVEAKTNSEHNGRDKGGDKKKNKDREKKSKSKDKHRDKKEKLEKKKAKGETDTKETKFKGSSQSSIDTQNIKPETLLKENGKSIATSGTLGKRKELETNGLLHENCLQTNKLPRSIHPSHLVAENGLKSKPSQILTQSAPEKQGFPFNHKADIKEKRINGLAETQLSNSASVSSSSATVQTVEKYKASARPPHPDTKYLSQILSVPKVDEVPDFDEQEWLFSHKNLQSKKMEVASPSSHGTMQVWAEALPIKSADVSALPYVVPF